MKTQVEDNILNEISLQKKQLKNKPAHLKWSDDFDKNAHLIREIIKNAHLIGEII